MHKCLVPGISPADSVARKFVPTVSFARDAGGSDPDEREAFKSACKRPTTCVARVLQREHDYRNFSHLPMRCSS